MKKNGKPPKKPVTQEEGALEPPPPPESPLPKEVQTPPRGGFLAKLSPGRSSRTRNKSRSNSDASEKSSSSSCGSAVPKPVLHHLVEDAKQKIKSRNHYKRELVRKERREQFMPNEDLSLEAAHQQQQEQEQQLLQYSMVSAEASTSAAENNADTTITTTKNNKSTSLSRNTGISAASKKSTTLRSPASTSTSTSKSPKTLPHHKQTNDNGNQNDDCDTVDINPPPSLFSIVTPSPSKDEELDNKEEMQPMSPSYFWMSEQARGVMLSAPVTPPGRNWSAVYQHLSIQQQQPQHFLGEIMMIPEHHLHGKDEHEHYETSNSSSSSSSAERVYQQFASSTASAETVPATNTLNQQQQQQQHVSSSPYDYYAETALPYKAFWNAHRYPKETLDTSQNDNHHYRNRNVDTSSGSSVLHLIRYAIRKLRRYNAVLVLQRWWIQILLTSRRRRLLLYNQKQQPGESGNYYDMTKTTKTQQQYLGSVALEEYDYNQYYDLLSSVAKNAQDFLQGQMDETLAEIQKAWIPLEQSSQPPPSPHSSSCAITRASSSLARLLSQHKQFRQHQSTFLNLVSSESLALRQDYSIRLWKARAHHQAKRLAAVVIQSWWRWILCAQYTTGAHSTAEQQQKQQSRGSVTLEEEIPSISAIKLQSWWRMIVTRRNYTKLSVTIALLPIHTRQRMLSKIPGPTIWGSTVRRLKKTQEQKLAANDRGREGL